MLVRVLAQTPDRVVRDLAGRVDAAAGFRGRQSLVVFEVVLGVEEPIVIVQRLPEW